MDNPCIEFLTLFSVASRGSSEGERLKRKRETETETEIETETETETESVYRGHPFSR